MLQVGQWSQTYTGVTGYEAPEQIQMTTDQYDSTLSDLYTVGVMLYEIVVGEVPF